MATISRREIIQALERMGELAIARGTRIEIGLVGGALMVLLYEARASTRDVDAIILAPPEASKVREIAKAVADERNWSDDWLNDAAKGFLVGLTFGTVIFSTPGIEVRRPETAQLLAMKLSAWRDDVDIADARRLLQEMHGNRTEIWDAVEPYLFPGNELKAQYAFADLWGEAYGDN